MLWAIWKCLKRSLESTISKNTLAKHAHTARPRSVLKYRLNVFVSELSFSAILSAISGCFQFQVFINVWVRWKKNKYSFVQEQISSVSRDSYFQDSQLNCRQKGTKQQPVLKSQLTNCYQIPSRSVEIWRQLVGNNISRTLASIADLFITYAYLFWLTIRWRYFVWNDYSQSVHNLLTIFLPITFVFSGRVNEIRFFNL